MTDTFRNALEHYADIPFDGTALDEFGYMMLKPKREKPFRDRFYGHGFAAEYKRRTGMALERTLFDMRFAPQGRPEARIRAINWYFDVMREGPLRVEKAFYKMSKQIFGPRLSPVFITRITMVGVRRLMACRPQLVDRAARIRPK